MSDPTPADDYEHNPPTEKLEIAFPDDMPADHEDDRNDFAVKAIAAKAAELTAAGKPARFEVWYPTSTAADFDAVEVAEDGTITTLNPYAEEAGK